jgi:hypothetical protein
VPRASITVAVLLVALFSFATWIHPIKVGLRASYYPNNQWAGTPLMTRIDQHPDTNTLARGWPVSAPEVFSVTWSGALLVAASGPYTFAATSDDGSWLVIDGRTVVDNRGNHPARTEQGDIVLARGVHGVRIQYAQEGGDRVFSWAWASRGQALRPIPTWATTSERGTFAQSVIAAMLFQGLVGTEWLFVAVLAFAVVAWSARMLSRHVPRLVGDDAGPMLALILIGSAALGLTAIWWGLPGGHWAPDEITPSDLWQAASQRFTHGWGSRYPPLHFYVLTVVSAPVWILEGLGRLEPDGVVGDVVNTIATRLVSTAASIGTLLFLYATARRLVGHRAALLATAQFALAVPFVYYAKTANLDVPYLFYFAIAFWAYIRIVDAPQMIDLLVYAAAAAAAMCTKDQAYGLFILPSLLIFARVRRSHADAGVTHPTWRTLTDRRMVAAVGLGLAMFVAIHNLLFNWSGFLLHLTLSAGSQSEYRLFPNTLAGQARLLWLSVDLLRMSWGWPLLVAAIAGAAMMVASATHRRMALVICAPIVSYYAAFNALLGYNYDRFMLPVMFLGAMFGGYALARLTGIAWRRLGITLAASVFAYSLFYASAVDVAMLRDTRYTTEAFLATQPESGAPTGFVFPIDYYPRLSSSGSHEVTSIGDLNGRRPGYVVINDDYASFEPPETDRGVLLTGIRSGALGYLPVFHAPGGFAFRWLPWPHRELAGPRPPPTEPVTSSLRHIGPTYSVYVRDR